MIARGTVSIVLSMAAAMLAAISPAGIAPPRYCRTRDHNHDRVGLRGGLADRLDLPIGTDNYKKHRGFDQGKGLEGIVQRLQEVNILSMDYRRDFDLVQILPDDTKPIKLSVQETSSIRLI